MRYPWTEDELEMLQQLAVDHPSDRMPTIYRTWAAANGYPVRSIEAIRTKASRLRITDRATGDWVSVGYVCRLLGVTNQTTNRWTDKYGIKAHRDRRNYRYFSRKELRRVAIQHPERFAGIKADRLYLLLEDRELAESIASAYPRRHMDPQPVRCVETGWRYPSVRAAACSHRACRTSIQRAIRLGYRSAGYHWEYAS